MPEELFITREDLKDYIHSIHNFLRNNGAGYGAMGMKIFNVFYGLKLIQPYLNNLDLTDKQKQTLDFNELVKKANDNNIEIMKYIDTDVLDLLFELKNNDENDISNNLGHFIYHQIPRGLKDNIWKEFIKKIDKIPVGYSKERKVNLSGKVYEYFVGRDKNSISELGAYFTDRHITDFIYNKLEPTLDDNNNVKTRAGKQAAAKRPPLIAERCRRTQFISEIDAPDFNKATLMACLSSRLMPSSGKGIRAEPPP
jgi:hypothetical protein